MLQGFYPHANKIMRLNTPRKAIHAGKPTPTETSHEIAQTGKSTLVKKSGENKKRKNRDRR